MKGNLSIAYLPKQNVIYNWLRMGLLDPNILLEEVLTHKLLLLLPFRSFCISLTYIYNICVCVTRTVLITVDYFKTLDQQKLSKE